MRRAALLAVALAAMLALAGCGGTGGTTTQTTTQATTQQTTTQASVDYPPGVTADGVESGFELTGAHAEMLNSENYTVSVIQTANYDNGTSYESGAWNTKWTTTGEVHATQAYNQAPPTAEYNSIEAWTNGSTVAFQRSEVGNASSTITHVSGGVGEIDIVQDPGTWKEELYTLVASNDMAVSQTDDGDFVLSLDGDNTVTYNYAGKTREVTPTTLEFTVTAEGFVKKVNFEFDTKIDGRTVHVSRTIIFEQGATVQKPGWA